MKKYDFCMIPDSILDHQRAPEGDVQPLKDNYIQEAPPMVTGRLLFYTYLIQSQLFTLFPPGGHLTQVPRNRPEVPPMTIQLKKFSQS
jgi:hypothetical protein